MTEIFFCFWEFVGDFQFCEWLLGVANQLGVAFNEAASSLSSSIIMHCLARWGMYLLPSFSVAYSGWVLPLDLLLTLLDPAPLSDMATTDQIMGFLIQSSFLDQSLEDFRVCFCLCSSLEIVTFTFERLLPRSLHFYDLSSKTLMNSGARSLESAFFWALLRLSRLSAISYIHYSAQEYKCFWQVLHQDSYCLQRRLETFLPLLCFEALAPMKLVRLQFQDSHSLLKYLRSGVAGFGLLCSFQEFFFLSSTDSVYLKLYWSLLLICDVFLGAVFELRGVDLSLNILLPRVPDEGSQLNFDSWVASVLNLFLSTFWVLQLESFSFICHEYS